MKVMDRLPVKIVTGIVVIALVFASTQATSIKYTAFEKKAFIAGENALVETYEMNEQGELEEAKALPRGTEITVRDKEPFAFSGKTYDRVYLGGAEDRQVRFVKPSNIADSRAKVVLEKEIYVRTPVTIYENTTGPEIAGFAPKGTRLAVTGFAGLKKNGEVIRYKVRLPEDSAAGQDAGQTATGPDAEQSAGSQDTEPAAAPEGFVYSKYLVRTQEEADAVYNENGEYDKAKKAKYGMDLHGGKATDLDYFPYERVKIKGKEFCREARGMYLNYHAAVNNDKYIKLIRETGCNAVVIDIKSDTLSYQSPVAKKLSPSSYKKARVSAEEFAAAVREFREEGVYTIGRITCFNDRYYAKDHPEVRIRSKASGSGWPSAYSRDVWYYNVALAVEAVRLMEFDEIQFDYVRFPEQAYEMSLEKGTDFRNRYGETKAQAIQNFCFYAADQIHEAGAYFSVDVFGECSDGYVTAYGQYWPAESNIVDAISSMPYTDHFGEEDTWSEPKAVMSQWAKKAAKEQTKIPTPAAARTWITGYNTPFWAPDVIYDGKMLKLQVDALYQAGLDGGFIPWNSASPIDSYRLYKSIWDYEE